MTILRPKIIHACLLALTMLPQQRLSAESASRSFQACQKDALKKYAKGESPKLRGLLKLALKECRRQHPINRPLRACRSEAFKAYSKHKDQLKDALARCNEEQKQLQFSSSDFLPFRMTGQELFFSDLSLSESRKISPPISGSAEPSNPIAKFDCLALARATYQVTPPEYPLFGNDPRAFLPLQALSLKALATRLRVNAKRSTHFIKNQHLGQIYWHRQSRSLSTYLAASSCLYKGEESQVFDTIKAYYLVDKNRSEATPYFGVAHYKVGVAITAPQLSEAVKEALGDGYFSQRLKVGDYIVSASKVNEFDPEGLPKNLCRFPRNHKYLAMITPATKSKPLRLRLANIKTLCTTGDRMASMFLKGGKAP